jgi:hypothetical protein
MKKFLFAILLSALSQEISPISTHTNSLLNNLSYNQCKHCERACYTLNCRTNKREGFQLCLRCIKTITVMNNKNKHCAHCDKEECNLKSIISGLKRTSVDRSHSNLSLSNLLKSEGNTLELIIAAAKESYKDLEALEKHGFKRHQVRAQIWIKIIN